MSNREAQPLLRDDRQAQRDAENDHIHEHIVWLSPAGKDSDLHTTRAKTQRILGSRAGHYAILLLVTANVACIFADFLIGLYRCGHSCGKGNGIHREMRELQNALRIVNLIFSCLFLGELVSSIWAFGPAYFKSGFHCLDAAVILASFLVNVCLKGFPQEVGSIVIVLRFWRVFEIIRELSERAEKQMDSLAEKIEHLEMENKELKKELAGAGVNGNRVSE